MRNVVSDAASPRLPSCLVRGTASSVLRALPAALSVGVVLAPPAAAQTVITTNHYTTINLSNYGGAGVSIGANTTIAAGTAVLGTASGASLTNAGVITAGYDGVSLNRGGSVTNAGSISGGHIGVYTGNGLGSVANTGVITAQTGDAVSLYSGGSFTNSGRVAGGYSGVYAGGNGSSIQNAGQLSGTDFGVYLTGASQVTNSGTITGGEDGVIDVGAHGVVTNGGVITGNGVGVRMAADAVVDNSGRIIGGVVGVRLGNGGALTNAAGGYIAGGAIGVQAGDDVGIVNAGTIVDNTAAGVTLGNGDSLANGGRIAGVAGVLVDGSGTGITDTGIIASTDGGDAVQFTGTGANTLTLGSGAVIDGAIDGGNAANVIVLQGAGALTSAITNFGAGSALDITPGAAWVASGDWQIADVVNDGTLQPGLVGAPLALTGNFSQGRDGTLLVAVTSGGTSHFNITGSAVLGGNLVYVLAPGTYEPQSAAFLAAGGGVSGAFTSVTALQTGSTVQTQAAPVPAAAPVSVAIVASAQTANLVVTQVIKVTPANDALFAQAHEAMALAADQVSDTLRGHATAPSPSGCLTQWGLPSGMNTGAGIAGAFASAACEAGGWAEASGSIGGVGNGGNTQRAGFLAGLDRHVLGDTTLGVTAGYDSETLTGHPSGRAVVNTTRIGGYAGQTLGRFVLSADITDGFADTSTTRSTGVGNADGRGHANVLAGSAELGLPVVLSGWGVAPAAGIRVAHVSTGAISERARLQAFAVTASGAAANSVQPYLRMAAARTFIMSSGLAFTPRLSVGGTYEAGNAGAALGLTTADGTVFAAGAQRLDAVAADVGAGLTVSRGNFALTASYASQLSGNWNTQTMQAAMQVKF